MSKLAILGGAPVIQRDFAPMRTVGKEEADAVHAIVASGQLSGFVGADTPEFYGGPQVQALEEEAAAYFSVSHSVTFNSWTSGLTAALGALGVQPGDEVITSPWTMSACPMSIMEWGATPVFADIDRRTFNLTAATIGPVVTSRTVGILVPEIFGHPADLDDIMALANRYGLFVLADTAQSPGATYKDRFAGTSAHIGGISLNRHKHIQTGEGGIAFTGDADLARRMQLIRNHAESSVRASDTSSFGLVGKNYRLGEMEAAIARIQLTKLAKRVRGRQRVAAQLSEGFGDASLVHPPAVAEDCTHAYYVFGLQMEHSDMPISRSTLIAALRAEGVPGLSEGYQYLPQLPIFKQSRLAGHCPTAKALHERHFIGVAACQFEFTDEDTALVATAFHKVLSNIDKLREAQRSLAHLSAHSG